MRRTTLQRAIGYGAVAVIGAAALYVASDKAIYHFEQRNSFCVACHLTPTTVLHEELMADYTERERPRVLASPHHAADPMVRCIDCHHGEGFVGRFEVLAAAGIDTLVWLAGAAEEPKKLNLPFPDVTCARCHAKAARGELADGEFHVRPAHVDVSMRCIDCHAVHAPGDPDLHFLDTARVLNQCRICHPQM